MRDFPEFDGPMFTWPRVESVPNVREALAELHPSWVLALATNAVASEEADIWKALDRVGLSQFLDKVYCFRKIGHKKPSPEFFEYILDDLRIEPEQVVMVGDSFEGDVLGANHSEIRAIWFNEGTGEAQTGRMYRTIDSFKSLPGELEAFVVPPNP